jgi:hypothetical protein
VGKPEEPYYVVVVETYRISGSGLHGDIHVRPVAGEQVKVSVKIGLVAIVCPFTIRPMTWDVARIDTAAC